MKSRASGTSPKTIKTYRLALDNFVGYTVAPEGINTHLIYRQVNGQQA